MIGACVPHGSYGKDKLNPAISPRLTRRMNVINMPALSDASLHSVYTGVYKAWLEEFPAYSLTHIEPFAKVCHETPFSESVSKLCFSELAL